MASSDPRIVIALHSGGPAPSGHLEVAGEAKRPFTGWLDLLSALDVAMGRYGSLSANGGAPDSRRRAPEAR